jgi:protein-disulfide isomerase
MDLHCQIATWRFARTLVIPTLLGLLLSGSLHAEDGLSADDEERLVQRVREELMQELRESDFLQTEIEKGIQKYVDGDAEARAQVRAEQKREATEKAKNVRRVSADRDHVFGNIDAEVSLIEYSDFECPYCKRYHATPKEVVEAYAGRVNWVYRHFPLGFHNPGAQKQAEASECAGDLGDNDTFWAYTDAIYARTESNGKGFPLEGLVPLAEELGLDAVAFEDCLQSERHAGRVREDLEEGASIGITGTPGTILINNESGEVLTVEGALPLASVKAQVDQLLD